MATIILGTDSFFKNPTAEGHLLEVITYMQAQELVPLSNSSNKDYVQISYSANELLATASFSLPIIQSINQSGQIVTAAVDYLIIPDFKPGTGGTFKSASLTQYLMEIIIYLQLLESDASKNPLTANNVSASTDADEKTFSGTLRLPVTIDFNDLGQTIFKPKEYLL